MCVCVGQRVGCLSMVTPNSAVCARVLSQLKILARAMYSNPPLHGARIVETILNDPELHQQWCVCVIIYAHVCVCACVCDCVSYVYALCMRV